MKEREILDSELLVMENKTENYVSITSADTVVLLGFMKAILRRNDIHFFVKNETMLQVEPFLATTADSAQIMVRVEDSEHATQLLEDSGYNIKDSGEMTDPIGDFVHSVANGIPFLKDLRFELQMIIVLGTTAVLSAFALFAVLNMLGVVRF